MKTLHASIKSQDKNIVDIVVFSTESMSERTKGLLGLSTLHQAEGLLLNHCRSVHTMGMPYTIDVVYLNKKCEVIKIVHRLKPYRMSACLLANRTLELLAGEAKRLSLAVGMKIELAPNH